MLGRLHMSVDGFIYTYMGYSKAMHAPKQSKWNAFISPPLWSTPAEQMIRDIIRKRRASYLKLDDSMRHPGSPCKV